MDSHESPCGSQATSNILLGHFFYRICGESLRGKQCCECDACHNDSRAKRSFSETIDERAPR